MTAITQLRDEIARHPAGSHVARLLSWAEIHIGDQFDLIDELQQELQEANSREEQAKRNLVQALDSIALGIAGNPIMLYRHLSHDDWFRLARACAMKPPRNTEMSKIHERIEALGIEARAAGLAAFLSDPETHVLEDIVEEVKQALAA